MRKLILAAIFAVVVVSGCTSTQGQQPAETDKIPEDTPDVAADNRSNYTVYYTSSGFQPSELAIQKGETVVWVNNASSSMWVASDRHPTHTNYAGTSLSQHCPSSGTAFDQCSSGERYSFTFEKTGEWSYHNHEAAREGGTVTVVE